MTTVQISPMRAGDPFLLSCSVFVDLIMGQSENKAVLCSLYPQTHDTSVIKHLEMTHFPVVLMLTGGEFLPPIVLSWCGSSTDHQTLCVVLLLM